MDGRKFKDEAELEDYCCEYAWKEFGLSNMKIERVGKGIPDRMFFRRWTPRSVALFFVEFKDLGEEARKFQADMHDKIKLESGVDTYVCDNFEDFKDLCHAEVYT